MTTKQFKLAGQYVKGESDLGDDGFHVQINGLELLPERSLKVYSHSPDGFAWGYQGSGPSQLALAIMLHFFGEGAPELHLYHELKKQLIANLDGDFCVDVTLEIEGDKLEAKIDHADNVLCDHSTCPADEDRIYCEKKGGTTE